MDRTFWPPRQRSVRTLFQAMEEERNLLLEENELLVAQLRAEHRPFRLARVALGYLEGIDDIEEELGRGW